MLFLYVLTVLLLTLSLCADRRRTLRALRIALRRFTKVAPGFLVMLVLVAVALYVLPEQTMVRLLARDSRWLATASALGVGSVSVMPGFIAFPLCGALRGQGVPHMVLAAFATSLMTVGVLTYPLERQYFGRTVTLVRNGISLLIALAVAVVTGIVFGEIRW